jgi:RNase H-like domain found in reverse transcriptase/Reverse transcriptase (RNA-dependent DNA polymerase)/Integrase zinc binding domain/Chromo (CHRromatin Organisation MOdifier) domain
VDTGHVNAISGADASPAVSPNLDAAAVASVLKAKKNLLGWQQHDFHEPFGSFHFVSSNNMYFDNDFVAFHDPLLWRPVHKSVLVHAENCDALLLALSGDKVPGSFADLDWGNPSTDFVVSLDKPKAQPASTPTLNALDGKDTDWSCVEVPKRMVLRTRLEDIQRMCGQKFTLDASCDATGASSQFPRNCASTEGPNSLGPFSKLSSLDGEHVWCNLLSTDVDAYMTQYFALKQKSPTSVSGCFLVPVRKDCEWSQHFSHMQVLKEYPAGTSLFFTMNGEKRHYLPGVPGPFRVYFDPQDPSIAASSSKPKFLLKGRIFSAPGRILIDNGANTQYVGIQTCKRMGGVITQLKEQPRSVQVGDGRYASVVGACRIPVAIGAYRGFVTALVLDQFSSEFDLVLGESWLKAYKAQLNYGAYSAMRLRVANRVVVIRIGQRGSRTAGLNALVPTSYRKALREGSVPADLMTTPNQLKKALKQNNGKYFMINVRYRERQDETVALAQFSSIAAQTTKDGRTEVMVTPEAVPFDHPLDTAGVYSAEPSSVKAIGGKVVVDELRIRALLDQYKDVFPEGLPPGMPPNRKVVHPIPLEPTAKPSYRPMYRLSPEEKEECENQVKDLLDKGLIQPSSSPWGAPVLFVPKPNGKLRMCCDFRMLNKQTIKNKFPLPRIDDLLDLLHGKKVFSSLDLQSGYWQIALRPEDMRKTAFNTHFGHFEYKVMCFGLANAPATFQSLMNDIFKDYLGKFVVVYLDDILIYSDNPEQHMRHLELVLQRLRQHKLYAQLAKCDFGLSELKFLGHIIGEFGVKPDPAKVQVVQDWPEPTNAAELRSFLGLAQYFRKFIQGYAQVASGMYDLLKANAVFNFSDTHRKAFEQLKYSLANAPVLNAPDFSQQFELWTDASTHGIGSVLMQQGHPVAYESRKLSSAEFNYTTTEQELLAVVHSLKVFRPYLQSKFTTQIFTDHRALEWLLTKQDVSRREARWLEEISRYNLRLSYIPGRTNVADPISRIPALMNINSGWFSAITRAQAQAQQLHTAAEAVMASLPDDMDSDIVTESLDDMDIVTTSLDELDDMDIVTMSLDELDNNSTPQGPNPMEIDPDQPDSDEESTVAEMLTHLQKWYAADAWFQTRGNLSKFSITRDHSGLYYRDSARGRQLVIPGHHELRAAIIREHHDPPYAGHRGAKPTEQLIQRLYWWPGMQQDVVTYVGACTGCTINKSSTKKPYGVAKSLPTPFRPWECFSMDWMTDFAVTKHGFDSILVVVDYLTKLAHFIPCRKDQSSEEVARILRREVIRLHGVSEVIVSDRDPKLVGNFMKDLFRCLGVKHKPSTAYRPQTDGQTERLNRVIQEMLRNYVSPSHDDWDEYLDLAEFAYNNSYHESIKTTPFRLTYGLDPRSPLSTIKINVAGTTVDFSYIRPTLRTCGIPSSKACPVNIPGCKGVARYYNISDAGDSRLIPECPAARKFTSYMQQLLQHARRCLEDAKQRQRAYAQKRMLDEPFRLGEYVWLSTVNLRRRLKGTPKLMPKFVGPFKITKVVNETAYMLDINETKKKIHNVFHASLFKRVKGQVPKKPMPIILAEDADVDGKYERYEVEVILDHRVNHRSRSRANGSRTAKKVDGVEYLIKWKGFDVIHCTWEPSTNVDKCNDLLREYWQSWSTKNPGKTPLMIYNQ